MHANNKQRLRYDPSTRVLLVLALNSSTNIYIITLYTTLTLHEIVDVRPKASGR